MRAAFIFVVVVALAVAVRSERISIEGLDKPTLLRALWDSAKVAAFYKTGSGPVFDTGGVASEVGKRFVDYYCGRAIKMTLSGSEVESSEYDRGSAEPARAVIESVRDGSYRVPEDGLLTCRGCRMARTTDRYHGFPICSVCKAHFDQHPDMFQPLLFSKDGEDGVTDIEESEDKSYFSDIYDVPASTELRQCLTRVLREEREDWREAAVELLAIDAGAFAAPGTRTSGLGLRTRAGISAALVEIYICEDNPNPVCRGIFRAARPMFVKDWTAALRSCSRNVDVFKREL